MSAPYPPPPSSSLCPSLIYPSSSPLTPNHLSSTPLSHLFELLPHLLISLENLSQTNVNPDVSLLPIFQSLLSQLCLSRPLKLRFLLLTRLPSFSPFWTIHHLFCTNPYSPTFCPEQNSIKIRPHVSTSHIDSVQLRIPVDIIDMQSLNFWTSAVFAKNLPKNHLFPLRTVTHPLHNLLQATNPTQEHTNAPPPIQTTQMTGVVSSAKVIMVFSSLARPIILSLRQPLENSLLHTAHSFQVIPPALLVKMGDNLMHDLGVQIMFRVFNHIWAHQGHFEQGCVPFAFVYEVFPTSASKGFMQAVDRITSLKKFEWDTWKKEWGGDQRRVNDMVRSAVGSYIGTFVLGGRDRHFDNVLVWNQTYMIHIDFSYILGNKPPIDGPPISLSPEMEETFRDLGVWDRFVTLCLDAYTTLRLHKRELLNLSELVFAKGGFEKGQVRGFISGVTSLNLGVKEDKARSKLKRRILESSESLSNWFKEYTHETIVPAWFGLLRKGFPPAKAVMQFFDELQKRKAKREAMAGSTGDGGEEEAPEKVWIGKE